MELQEFVRKTVVEIVQGLKSSAAETGMRVSLKGGAEGKHITFDLAVNIEESGTTDAGAKIKVFSLIDLGAEKSRTTTNSTINRITFGVDAYEPIEARVHYPRPSYE